ncbi:hypothetical protein [Halanaerobium salsuginis]|jgi:hypothetical protein|uniref:Uncharacterized protein n=1 Tax=Halanaerobium salsuginis TaxID=29563 RepID=A0A1I4LA35_9FIRM|nr:hypothetical protein [Halanaerobium salsuginis]SFL87507.1 hypothetical protein SAMN02983006_02261 [Halanaerobium salsuginis]
MDKLIVAAILIFSLIYTGRRLYRQIFLQAGCSSCSCGSHNNNEHSCSGDGQGEHQCCGYYDELDPEQDHV